MKCDKCGYDDNGTGDTAHVCHTVTPWNERFLAMPVVAGDSYAREKCMQAEINDLRSENSSLRASRIAYANEFPLNANGEPDVGSIHQNIRALKAENSRLRKASTCALEILECGDLPCEIAAANTLRNALDQE